MNATHEVSDERFIFKPELRSKLLMVLGAGILLFAIGVYMAMSGGGHEEHGAAEHASASITKDMVASLDAPPAEAAAAAEHHGVCLP